MLFSNILDGLSFDDILLIPQESDVVPSEVDCSTYISRNIKLNIPIISAAMDTVTESSLAIAIAQEGGMGIIHKNISAENQAIEVNRVKQSKNNLSFACKDDKGRLRVGAAVGINDDERVGKLVEVGVDLIVVDTAHGHSQNVIEAVKRYKKEYGIEIIAGNVATGEGAKALADAGVDAVKVGVGPGSICTTRVISGVGVPQMTAVICAANALKGSGIPVIADGGIKQSGDITKAIAAGASSVMLGSLLAGTDESPGESIVCDGKTFKAYRGMGSLGAMVKGSGDRYRQTSTDKGKLVPEGIEGRVPAKGPLSEFIYQMVGGLRAGMGYCGAKNIKTLQDNSEFVKITQASLLESHPHDIIITKEAPNYRE